MPDAHDHLSPRTRLVALGRPDPRPGAPVNVPVELTSTYHADGAVNYARVSNASWRALEEALGALEGGHALVFASGLGAVSAALSLLPLHGVVVVPAHGYSGTMELVDELAEAGRAQVRRVDISDTAAVVAALDGADLLWIESPTNPMLEVADLPALAEAARAAGAISVCDNTFATPLLQQPLHDGVDVVVHSVTKSLSGHSDVVLGACVTPDTETGRARLATLQRRRTLGGAIAGPMETYLALRGLRTLAVRLDRAQANAAELHRRLADHPMPVQVRYPGFGTIVALVLPDAEQAERVAAGCRVWTHSTSLGGVESQIERRRRWPAEAVTVPEGLLRLSVGIEDVDDLWRDLAEALERAVPSAGPGAATPVRPSADG